jgi:rhodanese-related sulfurtransferase
MSATISRSELKSKIDRDDDFRLVEALPRDHFRKQHLPGAISLPPDDAKQLAAKTLPDKNADIVLYCANASCDASEKVAAELEAQGYRHVRRYVEGKQDWVDAGLPTEHEAQFAEVPLM